MTSVLFAWEFGSGYGHIAHMLPVAIELKRRGYEPVFALREVVRAETLAAHHGFQFFQAPVYPDTVQGLPRAASFSEFLLHLGYIDASALSALVRAWRALVGAVKPRLVICDSSPTMLLTADFDRVARVNLGQGYTCPPLGVPMPAYRWWLPGTPKLLAGAEQMVLQNVNKVRTVFGLKHVESVASFLRSDAEFLCTYPELDHYRDRGPARYYGHLPTPSAGVAPNWPGNGRRLFGYLRADYPHLRQLIRAIAASELMVLLHIPGMPAAAAAQFRAKNLVISPQSVNVPQALASCDAVVCHASIGLASESLLAGKPLLLLPAHIEQHMVAQRIRELGAGLSVDPEDARPDFKVLLRQLVDNGTLAERAREFASRYAALDTVQSLNDIVDRCEALIA